jgi:hypothetical protein
LEDAPALLSSFLNAAIPREKKQKERIPAPSLRSSGHVTLIESDLASDTASLSFFLAGS